VVEKSTVRLSASASGEMLAMMRSRETPSAGSEVCELAADRVSAPAVGGAVGE
jgi:hypothetical protein